MSRFFSNSIILAVFCASFYLLTTCISWLASDDDTSIVHEQSFDRRKADQFWRQRRWEDAAVYYENLTSKDPFNGNAWFYLAECHRNQRFEYVRKIYRAERDGTLDEESNDEYMQQAEAIGDKAIEYYQRAIGFPRYSDRARFSMAKIMAFHGQHESALKNLSEAVDNAYVCAGRGGLREVYELRDLRGLAEFKDICNAERQNYERRRRGNRRK